MGRIDCRTPGRRRAERVMWVALYVLIIGCGTLLGYLGFGSPENLFAEAAARPAPAAPPSAAPQPTPAPEPQSPASAPASAPAAVPASTPAEPATFFGIPVE